MYVAPFVGAWIETNKCVYEQNNSKWSLPSWERGLKRMLVIHGLHFISVAPFVGAWIET